MGPVEPDHDPVETNYPQNINHPTAGASNIPVQFPPPLNYKEAQANEAMPKQPTMAMPFSYDRPGARVVISEIPEYWSLWRAQLFDCTDDPTNGAITFCFPCITFGQIAEIMDNGQTSCATSGILYGLMCPVIGLSCIYSSTYRLKLRNKFRLVESPAPDWITHLFFESCALSQAYRELHLRGIDPTIGTGWAANEAKLQQAGTNPPALQTMTVNHP